MYENMGRHLTWDELCNLIDGLAAGSEQTQYEVREKITNFNLEHECTKGRLPHQGPRHITYGIGMLEELLANIVPMDEKSKCFYLWHALPPCMKAVMRHDPQNVQQEYTDYSRLKQACINHSLTFENYVEERISRAAQAKRERDESPSPPPVARRQRSYATVAAVEMQEPVNRGRTREATVADPNKPYGKPDIPEDQMLALWEPKARLWREGLSPADKEDSMKRRLCVLCKESSHMMKNCPNANRMFKQGKMFYYHPNRATKYLKNN